MSKGQLIDEIRGLNPTASPEFLAQFNELDLQQYLDRLQDAHDNRLRITGWSRPRPDLRKAG